MAHEIEIIDGVASFFEASPTGKRMAWHNLGQCVREAQTSEGAMQLAHLDWEVQRKELFHDFDKPALKEHFGNVRSTDGKVLGVVGSRYHIVQNKQAFDFMDGIIQDGVARYETAGSLLGGSKVFALLQVKGHAKIADSMQVPYLLLTNTHDGTEAVKVTPTSVRVVCANTVRMAQASGKNVNFRHNSSVHERMKIASAMLDSFGGKWNEWVSKARQMANTKFDEASLDNLLDALYPEPKDDATELGKSRHSEKLLAIKRIYRTHPTQANIVGSNWGVYNAITYFENHGDHILKGVRNESSALRTTFGEGDKIMSKAFELLAA